MAYVVPTKRGTFEVRESRLTPKGPRSRTLATFREMTDEVIDKARSRASKPLERGELESAAARAGAAVPGTPVDRAARKALRLLAGGEQLDPMLRTLLLDALDPGPRTAPHPAVSDAARSATQWIGASPERRAEALRDLLELADALPPSLRPPTVDFPQKVLTIHNALRSARLPHAFGGALALAFYAEPRMTNDIDLNVFVAPSTWGVVAAALERIGIGAATGATPNRDGVVEISWDSNSIDLFLSTDSLHGEMPGATRKVPFSGSTIPIVSPEHLAVRKAVLDRPKDWLDIEQILVATSPLDLPEIEAWLEAMVGESDQRLTRLREIAEQLSLS